MQDFVVLRCEKKNKKQQQQQQKYKENQNSFTDLFKLTIKN